MLRKINKKVILILIIMFFVCFVFANNLYNKHKNNGNFSQDTINIYSWGEFIANGSDNNIDVNKEFTRETGIKINYKTFQNNEELFAKLSSGGIDCDVIIPSDYMISKLIKNNMLAKLDFSNIPNYKYIDNNYKNLNFDPENLYSVPYMWGTVGIFYNKNEIQEAEENITWDILWDPKYKNKILMFDNARDSFAISLLRLGHSINTTNPEHWNQAARELLIQKPLVQAYVMDQIFNKIGNGEAYIAPYYAGDAANIMKLNSNINFVIPKSGSTRFVDSMCIPANSKNKTLAEKYIDFMCRTDIALANLKQTGYSTPHVLAYESLDDSIKNNKIFYPDPEITSKSQIFVDLPDEINLLMDKLWIEVKAGGISENSWGLFWIIIILLITYVLIKVLRFRLTKK